MPTYQYACTACDHRFDTVQSFTDASLTECPECGGKLRKPASNLGVGRYCVIQDPAGAVTCTLPRRSATGKSIGLQNVSHG